MAYEFVIRAALVVFSIIVALIVFFTLWNKQWEILNTLYSSAASVLVLAVLLVAGRFVIQKVAQGPEEGGQQTQQ